MDEDLNLNQNQSLYHHSQFSTEDDDVLSQQNHSSRTRIPKRRRSHNLSKQDTDNALRQGTVCWRGTEEESSLNETMDTASDNDNKGGDCSDPRQTTRAVVDIPFRLPDRLFGESNSNNSRIRLKCIDCHAGGEPVRVVLSGAPRPC
jgi:hypothetical protein